MELHAHSRSAKTTNDGVELAVDAAWSMTSHVHDTDTQQSSADLFNLGHCVQMKCPSANAMLATRWLYITVDCVSAYVPSCSLFNMHSFIVLDFTSMYKQPFAADV